MLVTMLLGFVPNLAVHVHGDGGCETRPCAPAQVRAAGLAAKAAGVTHVVMGSVGGADRAPGVHHFEAQAVAEAALVGLNFPFLTVLVRVRAGRR